MAKQQSFADKAKAKKKVTTVNVKFVKTVKSEKGTYKFQEKFVKIESMDQITSIK